MRAETKKKHKMGKRFAVLIGVAATGVMALGAQTGAAASEGVVSYGTKLTIYKDYGELHGEVNSKVRKCTEGREVILFRKRPGPDRKLGATTSGPQWESHNWRVSVKGLKTSGSPVGRVYAKATPKVGDGFKCSPGYSRVVVDCPCHPEKKSTDPPARTRLRAQTALAGGESVDSTPPDLQLSGPKKQSPQKASCPPSDPGCSWICSYQRCDVVVRVSCGDEACTYRAWGKLTNVKMDKLDSFGPLDVVPGKRRNFGPELEDGEQRKQVRQALDEGENVQAKVTVKATDAAGNVATAKRTITLVK